MVDYIRIRELKGVDSVEALHKIYPWLEQADIEDAVIEVNKYKELITLIQ